MPTTDFLFSVWIAPRTTQRRGIKNFHLLYSGAELKIRTQHQSQLFSALSSELDHTVATHSRFKTFVHAGVVGWQGQGIVLPGRSHSGKSTLVSALVRAGGSLLSDEYAVLDHLGQVHPYPRPIGRREAPGLSPIRDDRQDSLGHVEENPLPIGLIAVSRYQAGAHWRPETLSPGHAVLELMENTVAARYAPERALAHLSAGVRSARVIKGIRCEAGPIASTLLAEVSGSTNRSAFLEE